MLDPNSWRVTYVETNFELVKQFMNSFEQQVYDKPTMASEDVQYLRVDLIDEELLELKEAMAAKDLVEIADALTDLLYVVYGAGCAFGIDLDKCFAEVHRSNMTKLGEDGKPIRRADGKVLKSSRYERPNLQKVLYNDESSRNAQES